MPISAVSSRSCCASSGGAIGPSGATIGISIGARSSSGCDRPRARHASASGRRHGCAPAAGRRCSGSLGGRPSSTPSNRTSPCCRCWRSCADLGRRRGRASHALPLALASRRAGAHADALLAARIAVRDARWSSSTPSAGETASRRRDALTSRRHDRHAAVTSVVADRRPTASRPATPAIRRSLDGISETRLGADYASRTATTSARRRSSRQPRTPSDCRIVASSRSAASRSSVDRARPAGRRYGGRAPAGATGVAALRPARVAAGLVVARIAPSLVGPAVPALRCLPAGVAWLATGFVVVRAVAATTRRLGVPRSAPSVASRWQWSSAYRDDDGRNCVRGLRQPSR